MLLPLEILAEVRPVTTVGQHSWTVERSQWGSRVDTSSLVNQFLSSIIESPLSIVQNKIQSTNQNKYFNCYRSDDFYVCFF